MVTRCAVLALAAALGCESSPPIPSSEELVQPQCDPVESTSRWYWNPAPVIRDALGADYVLVRRSDPWGFPPLHSEAGVPCDDVVDVAACESRLSELGRDDEPELAIRRGAVLETFAAEDFASALAPITTASAAYLIALGAGYDPPRCGREDHDRSNDGSRSVVGGFEVVVPRDVRCDRPRNSEYRITFFRHLVDVRSDGTLRELAREADWYSGCLDTCFMTCTYYSDR